MDYVKFYDRVAIASSARVPESVTVKPQYLAGGSRGGDGGSGMSSPGGSFGGRSARNSVTMDTMAGFRKPAIARLPTIGQIPLADANRGVSRETLAG